MVKSAVATLRRRVRQVVRSKRGFTLIEILIVVAIIGILAAIAVPNVTRALQTAKENADAANIASLQNAVDMYYIDKGEWPTEGAEFQQDLVEAGYLKEEVSSPLGGTYVLDIADDKQSATVSRQAPQQ